MVLNRSNKCTLKVAGWRVVRGGDSGWAAIALRMASVVDDGVVDVVRLWWPKAAEVAATATVAVAMVVAVEDGGATGGRDGEGGCDGGSGC
ncbi:hypothetical protein Tco_0255865 [Tanacetum coccineum]